MCKYSTFNAPKERGEKKTNRGQEKQLYEIYVNFILYAMSSVIRVIFTSTGKFTAKPI